MTEGLFDQEVSGPEPAVPVAEPPRYVGFWYRVLAYLIDSWLLMLVLGATFAVLSGWTYYSSGVEYVYVNGEWQWGERADFLVTWVLPALLTLLFWEYFQATPGKMLVKATIVDAETLGQPTPKQWVIRYFGYFVSLLPLGLGFVWIAIDPRKQGWHDKLANTLVIFRPRPR